MKIQIRKILKERGFIAGTPEWRKEYERIRKTTRNKDYFERRKKARLVENLSPEQREAYRKRWREKAARKRAKRKEEVNKLQREYYERNKQELRNKIYEARTRRNPARGLAKLIDGFRRGHTKYSDLARQLNTAIVQSHALTNGRTRKKEP